MRAAAVLLWITSTFHHSLRIVLAERSSASSLRAEATAAATRHGAANADAQATAARSSGASYGRSYHRALHRRHREVSTRQVPFPLYIPKIGLANVTPPTAFPPPPPTLEAWEDGQPVDTAIGNAIVGHFALAPTSTPPPTQAAIDLAFGCPVLLGWPSNLEIEAPDTCRSTWNGSWRATGVEGELLHWTKSCEIFNRNIAPVITYVMSNGDIFGNSQTLTTLVGTKVVLRDCAWNVKYTILEKSFWQRGKADADACEKYGSCLGTVYLQYVILDKNDEVVAQTAFMNLFQDAFSVVGPGGNEIATAVRMNGWSPMDNSECINPETSDPKTWKIHFSPAAPGIFSSPTEQWPIAELVTMIAVRDTTRMSTGMCEPDVCEISRGIFMGSITFIIACTVFVLWIIFRNFFLFWFIWTMEEFETQFCPRRMATPSKLNLG